MILDDQGSAQHCRSWLCRYSYWRGECGGAHTMAAASAGEMNSQTPSLQRSSSWSLSSTWRSETCAVGEGAAKRRYARSEIGTGLMGTWLNGYLALERNVPLRIQSEHILKLLARKRVGTHWAKYPFSWCGRERRKRDVRERAVCFPPRGEAEGIPGITRPRTACQF